MLELTSDAIGIAMKVRQVSCCQHHLSNLVRCVGLCTALSKERGWLPQTVSIVASNMSASSLLWNNPCPGLLTCQRFNRYSRRTDWRDVRNWKCNNNVHPSRHGTYDGVSMHPFETVFVKSSWSVGEPHLSRYTRWFEEHSNGDMGTQGSFDRELYYYAMCPEGRFKKDIDELFLPRDLTCTST